MSNKNGSTLPEPHLGGPSPRAIFKLATRNSNESRPHGRKFVGGKRGIGFRELNRLSLKSFRLILFSALFKERVRKGIQFKGVVVIGQRASLHGEVCG